MSGEEEGGDEVDEGSSLSMDEECGLAVGPGLRIEVVKRGREVGWWGGED